MLSTQHHPTWQKKNEIPAREPASDETITESLLRLQKEHEEVLRECHLLTITAEKVERKERLGQEAVSCIRRLANLLTDHQATEERIIIPIVQEQFDSEASATVRKEHEHILKLLRRVEEAITAPILDFNRHPNGSPLESLAEFDSFLRAHIARDENVLFWFAGLHISNPKRNLGLHKRQAHQ